MKLTKCVLAVALGLVTFLAPSAARADDVQVNISGLIFGGLPNCPPAPACSETLNGSFQWDNSTNTYVSGSGTFTASGVLGSMSVYLNPVLSTNLPDGPEVQVGLTDANSDEIVLRFIETGGMLATGTYPTTIFQLGQPGQLIADLICNVKSPQTADACNSQYFFSDLFVVNGQMASGGFGESNTVSVSAIPEPSLGLLLGTGLLGVLALRRKQVV